MSKASDARGYKRSWKNLLINKRYQLSFTLIMVGLATLLMGGLGIFVMHVANETTKVSKTSARGKRCPRVPAIESPHEELPAPPLPSMKLPDEPAPADGERAKRKIDVTLDEMKLPDPVIVVPPVPDDFGSLVVAKWTCELGVVTEVERLESGRLRILLALIGFGLMLVVGLAMYGIKMTHRVAGPLFKVQLYLAKMREGRFDKVYNLRKGDQLVDFYDHFKLAHAGVVRLEQSDIARLKSLIAAAATAGAGDDPTIVELRTMRARKEKSLE
ncbi:MAG: hypothetical protein ABI867_37530 [Kofleriaceae bacterium]